MLRNDIKFQYHGSILADACRSKIDYHNERAGFWFDESDLAEVALKQTTVEFREYEQTNGKTIQPVIDPTLTARYNECQSKLRGHESKIEEYERWERGFEANNTARFELDPDDIAYFGL